MEFDTESTRQHSVENSLSKRLWISHKKDYGMMLMDTETIIKFGVLNDTVHNKAYFVALNYAVNTQYKFKCL